MLFIVLVPGVDCNRHIIPEPVTNIIMNYELFWDFPQLLPTTGFGKDKRCVCLSMSVACVVKVCACILIEHTSYKQLILSYLKPMC